MSGDAAPFGALSDREIEVVRLVARGLTDVEIARRIDLSVRTVQSHVSAALRKTGAQTRTRLAVRALQEGVAPLHPRDP